MVLYSILKVLYLLASVQRTTNAASIFDIESYLRMVILYVLGRILPVQVKRLMFLGLVGLLIL